MFTRNVPVLVWPQSQQNAYIERYNRTVRYDLLAQFLFETVDQVREFATRWLKELLNRAHADSAAVFQARRVQDAKPVLPSRLLPLPSPLYSSPPPPRSPIPPFSRSKPPAVHPSGSVKAYQASM